MDVELPFAATADPASGRLVVSGDIDELSTPAFRDALRDATDDYTRPVVVDLDAVSLFPSMAVGTLLGAMARSPGTRVVASAGTVARSVLDMLSLYDYAIAGRDPDPDDAEPPTTPMEQRK